METPTPTPPPLVSCIVPVFNGEAYLAEAVDSILQQAYPRLEIIVVDDGSTDRTPEIVASYGDRVHPVRQANAGPAAARNRGVRDSRGDLVAFLDADDRWHPEKLARQVARFAARPQLDVSVTHLQNFWIADLREEEARLRAHRIARPMAAYLASTILARRRVFAFVGEFDPELRFGHSCEWFLRAEARGAVVEEIPEVLYYRRLHHHNRSRQHSAESREEFLRLVKAHLDRRRGGKRAAGL
jgi:glycosyltransferase involved in cell wall biosynthesis